MIHTLMAVFDDQLGINVKEAMEVEPSYCTEKKKVLIRNKQYKICSSYPSS